MFLERSKFRPYPVLVRHFFQRLFQNDFVAFEDQMKEKTISILAIIAILSAHVANSILMKYMYGADEGTSWLEKCFFASFIMLILGFITVFEWDILFPDSRDFANLMVLPIRLRTIFTAKFTSLCGFVGLFAFGANILAFLPFWFYLPKWQAEGDLLFFTRFIFVHLICLFAASFFVFFLGGLFDRDFDADSAGKSFSIPFFDSSDTPHDFLHIYDDLCCFGFHGCLAAFSISGGIEIDSISSFLSVSTGVVHRTL